MNQSQLQFRTMHGGNAPTLCQSSFLHVFPNYLNYYFYEGEKPPNTPPIVQLKTVALLRNLNNHPLLPLTEKGLRFSIFWYELKEQLYRIRRGCCTPLDGIGGSDNLGMKCLSTYCCNYPFQRHKMEVEEMLFGWKPW